MRAAVKSIFGRIKANDFAKSVISIGGGKFIAQVITIFTIPILSRIYAPTVFGDQQIIVSVATIILSFVNLGLGSAIMAMDNEEKAKSMFITCSILMGGISSLCVIALACVCHLFNVLNVSAPSGIEYILLWFYIFVFNLQANLSILANRLVKNKLLLANPIITSLCNLLIAIPLGLSGCGYYGLMGASILGISIAVVQMHIRLKPFETRYSTSEFFSDLKLNKAYVMFQCPAGIIGCLAQQLPTQAISRVYNSAILGHYSMCVNLVNYPISFIGNPIGAVYFRRATEYMKQGEEGLGLLSDFSYKVVKNIMLIAMLPVVIYILLGEQLVTIILGDAWKLAGRISVILIYPYVLYFCSMCMAYCRVSIGRQKVNLFVSIVKMAFVAISLSVGILIKMPFENMILLYAIAFAISNVVDIGLSFAVMKRNLNKFIGIVAISSTLTVVTFLLSSLK